jgi:SAM-dependent methyltransferase
MNNPPRRNLILSAEENFRPPIFKPNTSPKNRLENRLRRFLDLQAGSIWRDLQDILPGVTGDLLDIGCGAQVYRALIPPHVNYQGVDTADAKSRFGYAVPDTHYFSGDDWGVADASFDTALCTEVLEHIENPAAFLSRAARCLRPGGLLVLTVPFAARWHFIPYDYWRYTPASLKILLAAAGFEDVFVAGRGNPLTVACYKVITLNLALLFGPGRGTSQIARRILGLLLSPLLAAAACLANLTLAADWGDDWLGFTVTARRI